jgi:CspA family cold shock protein
VAVAALGRIIMTDAIADEPVTQKITGTLKWFDRSKGFGFLTAPEYDGDIFLHESILADAVGLILLEGSVLEVLVQEHEQGIRVSKIISIETQALEENVPDYEVIARIPAIPARVKWFDRDKGFGFANAFRGEEDIFVHSSVLQRYGIKELNASEAVSLRVQYTERGAIAVDICDWVPMVPNMN